MSTQGPIEFSQIRITWTSYRGILNTSFNLHIIRSKKFDKVFNFFWHILQRFFFKNYWPSSNALTTMEECVFGKERIHLPTFLNILVKTHKDVFFQCQFHAFTTTTCFAFVKWWITFQLQNVKFQLKFTTMIWELQKFLSLDNCFDVKLQT